MSRRDNNPLKIILIVLAAIVAISAALWIIGHIVPILIVCALLAGGYFYFNRKALGGGRKTLP